MASEIKFESIFAGTQASKQLEQMKNGSVVFEFYNGMAPIACDLDYLYATTSFNLLYRVKNLAAGRDDKTGIVSVDVEQPLAELARASADYRFIDVVRELAFKYGLKHEYYKNKYGKWVDVSAIRPYFGLLKKTNNIFSTWYTGIIDDNRKETSIYTKVCENAWLDFHIENDPYRRLCEVKDLNVLPEVDYIVKDRYSNSGFMHHILRADGTYHEDEIEKVKFIHIENDNVDQPNKSDAIRFSYSLVSYANGAFDIPAGDYRNNNHQLFEDLKVTFTNPDGTPYTDTKNMLISCNGVFVDYVVGESDNTIYIPNVVKYAQYQHKTIKSEFLTSQYRHYETDGHGNKIICYDIPENGYGTNFAFDIKITKWKGVKISHFTPPTSSGYFLKCEQNEPTHRFWLRDKLTFAYPVSKSNTILLCGNTIVDKKDWSVDEYGDIHLDSVSDEWDIVYARNYANVRAYLKQVIDHDMDGPKLSDYMTEIMTPDSIDEAYAKYEQDMENWMATSGGDMFHHAMSPFNVTEAQFINRIYTIVRFTPEDDSDYKIEVSEDTSEIELNRPLRNTFRNKNWSSEDLVIANGLTYEFVNLFEDVFTAPMTWYRTTDVGIFDDAHVYKLKVIKHFNEHDRFRKLNYSELTYGPVDYRDYYRRSTTGAKLYYKLGKLTEFASKYILVDAAGIAAGMQPDTIYYTIDPDDNEKYIKVPDTVTEFAENKQYFVRRFTEDYYILK